MYQGLLHTHNLFRWIVLILALLAIYQYVSGWLQKKNFSKADNRIAVLYISSLHLQLLIGLVLYFFLSPITKVALNDFGLAMKDAVLRFWAVEHFVMMLLAIIIAQVGRIISKKRTIDEQKFKIGAVYFIISLLIILLSIPWPFRENIGRGWFPGM